MKPSAGSAVRPNRATRLGRATSAQWTETVAGSFRTTRKRSAGFAAQPNRDTPSGRPTSAG